MKRYLSWYHIKRDRKCEVNAMPFWAGLFAGAVHNAVQKEIARLENRVLTLEVELAVIKRKVREHDIE